ncbi:hypothetical protein EMMF5_006278 [Cystobasidiomycetes sp. EMM_F5]
MVTCRLSVKVLSLSGMCILMTVLAIVMHISRTHIAPGQPRYKAASAVLLTEVGKLLCSLGLAYRESRNLMRKEQAEQQKSAYSHDGGTYEMNGGNGHANGSHSQSQYDNDSQDVLPPPDAQEEKQGLLSPASAADPSWGQPSSGASVFPPFRWKGNGQDKSSHIPITPKAIAQRTWQETFSGDWLKLIIPAMLFTMQGNLAYYASSNLTVPVFQITYQLKIPATALCSVLMLSRVLSNLQWASIALLSIGVGVVQLASTSSTSAPVSAPAAPVHFTPNTGDPLLPDTAEAIARAIHRARGLLADGSTVEMNQFLGLAAVVLACLSSGFASVYFERVLKKPSKPVVIGAPNGLRGSPAINVTEASEPRKTGLWVRNIQLSIFSLLAGSIIYIGTSVDSLSDFFVGFTPIVWFVVLLQVAGGLTAALVIKYADNIAKSFSASVSIILSFGASVVLFDYKLSLGVIAGSAAVVGATWLFSVFGTT